MSRNRNPVLVIMRDSYDPGDPFGSAMAWAFAVAENLADYGSDVPSEMGYQSSIAGPILESHEDFEVWHLMRRTQGHWVDPEFGATVEEVQEAGRILSRFIDWCHAAGVDY